MGEERYYFQNSDGERDTEDQHTEDHPAEASYIAGQEQKDPEEASGESEYYSFGEKRTERERPGGKKLLRGGAALFFVTAAVAACGVLGGLRHARLRRTPLAQTSLTDGRQEQGGEEEAQIERKGLLDVSDTAARALPSVVAITGRSVSEVRSLFRQPFLVESESSGSGFIIGQDEEQIFIATNYHVIEDTESLSVCLGDDEEAVAEASLVGSDPIRDLAVVAVRLDELEPETAEGISIITLGSSENLTVGQRAIAIGNALGYGQSVTQGVISALEREITVDGYTDRYIQTDAAINYGNSGGALLNEEGEVIGMNYAKASEDGVEGMGYAIPIDEAMEILQSLMEGGEGEENREPGYLGITAQELSEEAKFLYGIPDGIFVSQIEENGPAQKAGLRQGDVLCRIAGYSVTKTQDLEALMAYLFQGDTVFVEFYRAQEGAYELQTAELTLEGQPEEEE